MSTTSIDEAVATMAKAKRRIEALRLRNEALVALATRAMVYIAMHEEGPPGHVEKLVDDLSTAIALHEQRPL